MVAATTGEPTPLLLGLKRREEEKRRGGLWRPTAAAVHLLVVVVDAEGKGPLVELAAEDFVLHGARSNQAVHEDGLRLAVAV